MRSPADMQTIQIDITNACNKRCSNCTRFCGNHRKSFFMDYDTFCRAVDSLDGYDGVVGIMGGEPTLHPEFERFMQYIREKFGNSGKQNRMVYPQRDFIREIHRREFDSHVLRTSAGGSRYFKMCGPGLWSNTGESYRRHYELIQDTFQVQFLNDHIGSSYHQPGLFARKDLGIPDDQWVKLRDRCWIQNEWSATITPKGAFFCEIAGALDMLFDGPGGWKIEPDWWRRTPEEFGDQLHWCELCGFALDTFMRDAEEEVDDASPTLYKMLQEIGSPRILAGKTNLVMIKDGVIQQENRQPEKHLSAAQPFIEHYEDRFNAAHSVLLVKEYETVQIPDGDTFGRKFNQALSGAKEWILFCQKPLAEPEKIRELTDRCILNPGTLHLGDGYALFSRHAQSIRQFGYDRLAHMKSFDEVVRMWQKEKVVRLKDLPQLTRWSRDSVTAGKRYVIWGTGLSGSFLADAVQSSGGKLVFAVDRDPGKDGEDFYGARIHGPGYLAEHKEDFDCLLIGHYSRFSEIREEALKLGIDAEHIRMPYEI